jgi:serine/threonine protein kinase
MADVDPNISPERWREISHLYRQALPLDEHQRRKFLASACSDESLLSEVWSLLSAGQDDPTIGPPQDALGGEASQDEYQKLPSERLLELLEQPDIHLDRTHLALIVRVLRERDIFPTLRSGAADGGSAATHTTIKGIRGWLLVFVLHMIVSLLPPGVFGVITLLLRMWIPAAAFFAFASYGFYTVIALLRKRPQAVAHARTWTALWAIVFAYLFPAALVDTERSLLTVAVLSLACSPGLWLPYLVRSERVALTFVGITSDRRLSHVRGWLLTFDVLLIGYSLLQLLWLVPQLTRNKSILALIGSAFGVYGLFTGASLVRNRPGAPHHARTWIVLFGLFLILQIVFDNLFFPIGISDNGIYFLLAMTSGWYFYLSHSERVADNFSAISARPTWNEGAVALASKMQSFARTPAVRSVVTAPLESSSADATRAGFPADGEAFDADSTFGTYTILRQLGAGGMGTVYLAEQRQPRRHVALKVMKAGQRNVEMLRRFRIEAEVLGRLRHPGIAHIYEGGTIPLPSGDCPFFAMEYVAGESLLKYVDHYRLNVKQRLNMVASICDAMDHAHHRGIVHRDLKPANILVDERGMPKVLDFGVAHLMVPDDLVTRMTTDGRVVGTLAYMSPEQVRADSAAIDARSDVYALGVILYEMLSGHLPYDVTGDAWHLRAQAILETEPMALGLIDRALKGDIEVIVAKALEKEPARRYNSAADLAADLRRYLSDHPINARRSTATYRIRKYAKRNAIMISSAVGLTMMLMLFWRDVRMSSTEFVFGATGAVEVRGITPPPGSVVSRDTIVIADLAFSINSAAPAGFQQGQFRIEPHVKDSATSGFSLADMNDTVESPVLQTASGNVRLRLPMRALFEDSRFKPPYEIEFSVMQMCGKSGFCSGVAATQPVRYVTDDTLRQK